MIYAVGPTARMADGHHQRASGFPAPGYRSSGFSFMFDLDRIPVGAVHSHARRDVEEGIPPAELKHVAILAIDARFPTSSERTDLG